MNHFLKGSAVTEFCLSRPPELKKRHSFPAVVLGLAISRGTQSLEHLNTWSFVQGRPYGRPFLANIFSLRGDCFCGLANCLPSSSSIPDSELSVWLDLGRGSQVSLDLASPHFQFYISCCPWLSTLNKSNCLLLFRYILLFGSETTALKLDLRAIGEKCKVLRIWYNIHGNRKEKTHQTAFLDTPTSHLNIRKNRVCEFS